jgi:hypothetical protein
MTSAAQHDLVRTTLVAASLFDSRSIPAGMEGTVLDARRTGPAVELAFTAQTAEHDSDFVQAVLTEDKYEVISRSSRRYRSPPSPSGC